MSDRQLTVDLVEGLEAVEHLVRLHERMKAPGALETTLTALVDEKLLLLIVRARKQIHGIN